MPGNALRQGVAQGLRPLNPDERVENPDGSHSTERTVTVQMPDGTWGLVPSLWMTPAGKAADLRPMGDDYIANLARMYEESNGTAFPRFGDLSSADDWAVQRSVGGGAGQGALAQRDRPR